MTEITLSYTIHDVFTRERFKGNPLAIVQLPDSDALTQEQKHKICNEFNLSETVFLHPQSPNSGTAGDADAPSWRIDIFTPGVELPFAGHPTIGSACFVGTQHLSPTQTRATLETKAGPIPLTFVRDAAGSVERVEASIPHDTHVHAQMLPLSDLHTIQPALKGVGGLQAGFPVFSIVNGMNFALLKLDSLETLSKIGPVGGPGPEDFVRLDEGWRGDFIGEYYYAIDEERSTGNRVFASTRMCQGSLEDAATGSAASGLASFLAMEMQSKGKVHGGGEVVFEFEQGVQMGRRSVIGIRVVLRADGGIEKVFLSGSAVQVMAGTLTV